MIWLYLVIAVVVLFVLFLRYAKNMTSKDMLRTKEELRKVTVADLERYAGDFQTFFKDVFQEELNPNDYEKSMAILTRHAPKMWNESFSYFKDSSIPWFLLLPMGAFLGDMICRRLNAEWHTGDSGPFLQISSGENFDFFSELIEHKSGHCNSENLKEFMDCFISIEALSAYRDMKTTRYYSPEEQEKVEAHIEKYFGKAQSVYHELVSPGIHVDIHEIPPTPEHSYCLWVTCGMGAYQMNVLEQDSPSRMELVIALPADWHFDQLKELNWGWPFNTLKYLARYPISRQTGFACGHTIVNDDGPFAPNTQQCGVVLEYPFEYPSEALDCSLTDTDQVRFLQIVPLYKEEIDYKVAHGIDALEKLFRKDFSMVVNPVRPNHAADSPVVVTEKTDESVEK